MENKELNYGIVMKVFVINVDTLIYIGKYHIRPLVEQKGVKEKDLDWSYYKLDNLQTLCKKCHREKTTSEVKLKTRGEKIKKKK